MEGQLQLQIGELSLSQKNEFLLEKLKLLNHSPNLEESVNFLTKRYIYKIMFCCHFGETSTACVGS